jgi:hypothetical protein
MTKPPVHCSLSLVTPCFPLEIKETKSPSQIAKRQFAVVDQLGRTLSSGVVHSMVERDATLSPI